MGCCFKSRILDNVNINNTFPDVVKIDLSDFFQKAKIYSPKIRKSCTYYVCNTAIAFKNNLKFTRTIPCGIFSVQQFNLHL